MTPCGIDSIHTILSIPNILTQWIRPLFESKVLIRKLSIPVCWFQRSELRPNVYIRNVRNWIVCPAGTVCDVYSEHFLDSQNIDSHVSTMFAIQNIEFSFWIQTFQSLTVENFRNFPLGNGRRAWPRTTENGVNRSNSFGDFSGESNAIRRSNQFSCRCSSSSRPFWSSFASNCSSNSSRSPFAFSPFSSCSSCAPSYSPESPSSFSHCPQDGGPLREPLREPLSEHRSNTDHLNVYIHLFHLIKIKIDQAYSINSMFPLFRSSFMYSVERVLQLRSIRVRQSSWDPVWLMTVLICHSIVIKYRDGRSKSI